MAPTKKPGHKPHVVTLKAVAQHLGLTPGTVSAVLNDSHRSLNLGSFFVLSFSDYLIRNY